MRASLGALVGLLIIGAVTGCTSQRTTPAPTSTAARTAVFIGDSYTAGVGATDSSHSFVTLVARAEGWKALNLGRGGTGYVTAVDNGIHACGLPYCGPYGESLVTVALKHPDVVVVSGGLNDAPQSDATFASGVDQFMSSLSDAAGTHTRVYVTSPLSPTADVPPALSAEAPVLRAATVKRGFHYLDLGQPIAGHLDLLFTDRVHPNDAGHQLIAKVIEAQIAAAR